MNLQYNGEEHIPVGRDKVWTFVTDPEKVGRCFPEVVEVAVQDQTHFDAVVQVGVGPVQGKFKLKVELMPDAAKRRLDMKISGGGFGSAVDMTAGADIVARAQPPRRSSGPVRRWRAARSQQSAGACSMLRRRNSSVRHSRPCVSACPAKPDYA